MEQIVGILAEDQHKLQEQLAELATYTGLGFDQLKEAGLETDRRMRETDERFRETDERIDKLVVAIGEFISRMPAKP